MDDGKWNLVEVHNFLQTIENSPRRGCGTLTSGGGRVAGVGSADRLAVSNRTKKQPICPPALLGFGRRADNTTSYHVNYFETPRKTLAKPWPQYGPKRHRGGREREGGAGRREIMKLEWNMKYRKIQVLWNTTPCGLRSYWHFRGNCCLLIQCLKSFRTVFQKMYTAGRLKYF